MEFRINMVYKLIGYLVIVSLLPLLIFAAISYGVVRDTILELTTQNSTQLINDQRDYLQQQVIQQIENLSGRISGNESINVILARAADPAGQARSAFDEMSSQEQIRISLTLYSNLKGIVSIDIITPNGHRYYVGDTLAVSPVSEKVSTEMMQSAQADPNPVHWLGVVDNLNTESPSVKVLSAVKVFRRFITSTQSTVTTGMLIINYSTDVLHDHFSQTDLGPDSSIYILDRQGRMIFTPEATRIGAMAPDNLRQHVRLAKGSSVIRFKDKESLVTSAKLEKESWNVVGIVPKDTLLAPMKRLTQVLLTLIVLSFGVIFLASQYFRKSMVAPIQAISDGFRRLYNRNIKVVEHLPVPKTNDEISELVEWFNTFLDTHAMRLKYEQDLIESQYKFSSIFNQAPMPLALVKIETGVFVDVNDFWLDQFGFSREETIGNTSIGLNMWIDNADRTQIFDQIRLTEVVNRLEIIQKTKDGRILIVQVSGRPLNFQGESHFIFAPVDITRQRQAEIEIHEMNQKLESRVLSRTQQLQKTNEDLNQALETLNRAQSELVRSEKFAALGSLVAGVAHEINTPVGIIVTSASVLNDASIAVNETVRGGVIRKSQILEYINVATESSRLIVVNALRAANLIQSFKQVAVDQTSEQRRTFDLLDFLNDLITSLNPSLKKSRIKIEVRHGNEKILMDSYPGLLAQVLTNLTMNSLTHAFTDKSNGHIYIEIGLVNETVEINFIDDGCGIPEQILGKIFDPFFTTRRGQGGTGLGLNIVFNIINKQFGGSIRASNGADGGAIFSISLPRITRVLTETEYIHGALH
ncbi:PAS domain S-box-containing protein [Oxalobacteraceae bacterium GrIS 2.11]